MLLRQDILISSVNGKSAEDRGNQELVYRPMVAKLHSSNTIKIFLIWQSLPNFVAAGPGTVSPMSRSQRDRPRFEFLPSPLHRQANPAAIRTSLHRLGTGTFNWLMAVIISLFRRVGNPRSKPLSTLEIS